MKVVPMGSLEAKEVPSKIGFVKVLTGCPEK